MIFNTFYYLQFENEKEGYFKIKRHYASTDDFVVHEQRM